MPRTQFLLLAFFTCICNARWYPPPPGLRGDTPPWGPAMPPVPPPWSAPPPSNVFRRPMDSMVDLTNDLAVLILQDYSHVQSNFAFSPYGLASVLVVLYEGTMGESARQIHMAAKFPWDRDITRIGFRDIHRHLRSYFSHEGYLSGISMNKNKSTLKPDYKRVLRFYGYDVDVEPPRPVSTTRRPMVQVPVITSTPKHSSKKPGTRPPSTTKLEGLVAGKESEDITYQSILNLPESTTQKTTGSPPVQSSSTTVQTTPEQPRNITTLQPSQGTPTTVAQSQQTTPQTTLVQQNATTFPDNTTTAKYSTTPTTPAEVSSSATTEVINSEAMSATTMEETSDSGMLVPQTTEAPLVPVPNQGDNGKTTAPAATPKNTSTTTEPAPTEESIESRIGDVIIDSTLLPTDEASDLLATMIPTTSDPESTTEAIDGKTSTDSETTTEGEKEGTTDREAELTTVITETTESFQNTPQEIATTLFPQYPENKNVLKRSPYWGIRTIDEYFLGNDMARKGLLPPLQEVAPISQDLYPRTLDEFLLVKSAPTNQTPISEPEKEVVKRSPPLEIRTLEEYFLGSDLGRKSLSPPLHEMMLPQSEELFPRTLDELLLKKDPEGEEFYPKTLDEYLIYKKKREMADSPINYKTELAFRRFATRRKSRTITDMLHLPGVPDLSLQLQNGMFDSHVSRKAELYRPLPRQAFLVDAAAETPVPVMTYTNVFPYAYIPRLHSTALQFPLDDERYKLLLILPNERRGLRQLTHDLAEVTVRGVLDALKPARVRATVPTFMVEGFVILTPALQRLGIWNVFDPRRANLSAMSTDPELYVRNVEQSVTVVIRNYVEILDIQTRTMAARSVEHEFIATHPFLYFVLDTETNVALMAGQMLDPLNSRVY